MDKELIKKWIAALRSGKYEQAYGLLKSDLYEESFCSLGVAMDVHPNKNELWRDYEISKRVHLRNNNYPPIEVIRDMGLDKQVPYEVIGVIGTPFSDSMDYCRLISYLNDCKQLSFNEIADWIEKHILNKEEK